MLVLYQYSWTNAQFIHHTPVSRVVDPGVIDLDPDMDPTLEKKGSGSNSREKRGSGPDVIFFFYYYIYLIIGK